MGSNIQLEQALAGIEAMRARVAELEGGGRWKYLYENAVAQLARIAEIVGNVNGDPEVAATLVREKLAAAEADYAACAEAIGVEYVADGHAPQPGPREAVVAHIREAVRDAGRYHEAEGRMFEMKEKLAVAVAFIAALKTGYCESPGYDDETEHDIFCECCSGWSYRAGACLKKLGVE